MAHTSHKNKKPLKKTSASSPRSLRYYLISADTHKAIGSSATSAYFQVVDFLQKELHSPKQLTGDLMNIVKKSDSSKNRLKKQQKANEAKRDLRSLTKRSNEVLISAKTVFPFTLFPDTIALDRTKLTIHKRDFFFSGKVLSIRIEDVLNVSADVGPFFGSITVASRVLSSEDHFTISHFWREDAIRLKHMIQGYVIAQHNQIDVKDLEKEELQRTLSELGHDLST